MFTFTVSQTALEAVLRDIKEGVTYPDFWADREAGEEEEASTEESED